MAEVKGATPYQKVKPGELPHLLLPENPLTDDQMINIRHRIAFENSQASEKKGLSTSPTSAIQHIGAHLENKTHKDSIFDESPMSSNGLMSRDTVLQVSRSECGDSSAISE